MTAVTSQPPWMALAWAELGQHEVAGSASNPRIADYIRSIGHPEAADDATAWCAAFVGACLQRAGIAGTGSLLARSYLDWGVPAATPPGPGAIVVLSRGTDTTTGHVGFLVGLTDDRVVLLGGNQSDAVGVEAFPLDRVLGLRVPDAGSPAPASSCEAPSSAASDFAWSLARILVFEGGWTDDPFDPGGPTNLGITLADYADATDEPVTADSMERLKSGLRAIPASLVERIYRERYWQAAQCPSLPSPLAHFHFDAAVNQGVGTAARLLQQAVGTDVDGEIGPLTLAAATTAPMLPALDRYAAARRARYRSLAQFWRFGRGWLARVDQALAQSQSLARPALPSPTPAAAPAAPARPAHPAVPAAPPVPPRTSPVPPSPDQDPTMTTSAPAPSTATPAPTDAASDGKWWGSSLTIWGTLLTAATTVLPTVFAALGFDVPADLIQRLGASAITAAQAISGLVGVVMTIVGRARASQPLERRPLSLRI